MRANTIVTACCCAALVSCLPQGALPASTSWTEVHTTNGLIRGHRASGAEDVIEYLGIPFAKPPIGELRFAPPEKFDGNGTYDAKAFVSFPRVAT